MRFSSKILLRLIRVYQAVRATGLIPPLCRFRPTCSHYAADAIQQRGLFHGLRITLRRLAKCHPFHPGGWDPL